jgi:hypothetical protein
VALRIDSKLVSTVGVDTEQYLVTLHPANKSWKKKKGRKKRRNKKKEETKKRQ